MKVIKNDVTGRSLLEENWERSKGSLTPVITSSKQNCELHRRLKPNHHSGVSLHDRSWNTSKDISYNDIYSTFHHDIFRQCSNHCCSYGVVPSSAIKTFVRLPCKHRSQRGLCYTTSPHFSRLLLRIFYPIMENFEILHDRLCITSVQEHWLR